jgi:hypothetical protein
VVINIDPVNDGIEDETSEHRIRAAIDNMNQRVKQIKTDHIRTNYNIDSIMNQMQD